MFSEARRLCGPREWKDPLHLQLHLSTGQSGASIVVTSTPDDNLLLPILSLSEAMRTNLDAFSGTMYGYSVQDISRLPSSYSNDWPLMVNGIATEDDCH
jgi:hypothetical protein